MANRTDIYDGKGKKIGTINHDVFRDNYYDSGGRFKGSVDRQTGATRDRSGRIVADKPAGGLLWDRE